MARETTAARSFATRGGVMRVKKAIRRVDIAAVVATLVPFVLDGAWGGLVFLSVLWVIARSVMDRSRTHAPWPAMLEASRAGLVIDGRRIDGATILSASVGEEPPAAYFRRRFLRRDLELRFSSAAEATRFVQATRFDPSKKIANLISTPLLAAGGCVTIAIALVLSVVLALVLQAIDVPEMYDWPLALSVVGLGLAAFCTRGTVRVGSDGIELRRWLWPRRWIPFSRVAQIDRVPMESGPRITLRLRDATRFNVRLEPDLANDAAIARIEEAVARRDEGGVRDDAILRRRSRAAGDWIRELRAIASGANADHRRAAVPLDRIVAALEDAEQPAEVRAAAAVAIAASDDDGARQRLRVLSNLTIEPKLRVAFRAALDEEPAALEAALDEIEVEVEPGPRRAR